MRGLLAAAVLATMVVCGEGCALVRGAADTLRAASRQCAQKTLDDFRAQGWAGAEIPVLQAIDDALRGDWAGAVSVLGAYAGVYGREFVDCVVAAFRAYYAGLVPPPGPVGAAAKVDPVQRGFVNADQWLSQQ